MKRRSLSLSFAVLPLMLVAAANPATASLVLTAAGVTDGFSLTTFVSGYNAQYGPLSVGVLANGNLITGSAFNNNIYIFSDTDGQTLSSALSTIPYTNQTSNPQYIMATVNGTVYGAQVNGGAFGRFSTTGAFTQIPNLVAAGVTAYYGMWTDSANNHLIASSSKGLVEIDPVAGTYRVINSGLFPDGVTVSPDGTVLTSRTAVRSNPTTLLLARSFKLTPSDIALTGRE